MSVISCERTTTLEGYSSIHAIVQLKNDGMMKGVDDNIRLHFAFVREPQHNNTAKNGDSEGEVILHADADDDDNHDVDVEESGNYSDSDDAVKRKRSQGSQKSNKQTTISMGLHFINYHHTLTKLRTVGNVSSRSEKY